MVTVDARPWTQSSSGVVAPNRRATLVRRHGQREASSRSLPGASKDITVTLDGVPSAGYLYGALEVVGLPDRHRQEQGRRRRLPARDSLRYNAGDRDLRPQGGRGKVSGTGSKKTLTLSVRNTGNTIAPVTGTVKLKGALGTKNGAVKATRILPGKSVALGLASASSLRAGSYTATVTLIQNKQKTTLTKKITVRAERSLAGGGAARRAPHPGRGRARRAARAGRDRRPHRRDAARGRAGAGRARVAAAARAAVGRCAGCRELLAGVPEPLADLDHVPATAATVLDRVRYLHEHYELERCRVLLLGDHDATSLAFGALGASVRELAVVDVDQRQLRYLASYGVDTWFADLRVGPAGAAARALRHRPHRPAVLARRRRAVRGAGAGGDEARVAAAGRLRLPGGLARARAEGPDRALRAGARLRGGAAGLQRLRRRAGRRLARRAVRAAADQALAQDRGAARRAPRGGAVHARAPGGRVRPPATPDFLRELAARAWRTGRASSGRCASCSTRRGRRRRSSSTSRPTSSTASTRWRSRRWPSGS